MSGPGDVGAHGDAGGPGLPQEDAEELYELSPCGHLSTLPDGTITRVNATLLSWLGLPGEEVVGRRFAELLTAGGRIYHETHYAPLLSMQGHAREIALDMVGAEGRRIPVLVNAVLVRDAQGRPRVIRTSIFEASDRREYERELLRARERAERSEAHARQLAQTLQASLIPPELPEVAGLEVGAAYRPAGAGDEVGGDFYDVFETGEEDWAVIVGDVCGKGAQAATVTALARYTIRAAAIRTPQPSDVLATLNAALLRQPIERFCTVVYARVRCDEQRRVEVTIASGGHPLPIRIGADAVEPVGRPGSLLGVLEIPELHDTTILLHPGETLFCYTDGLTEARRGSELFGDRRLLEALTVRRGTPPAQIPQSVVDELVDFQGGRAADDMAAVVVSCPPSRAPGEDA